MTIKPIASYIIPFHYQDKARLENLNALLDRVCGHKEVEVILVEQDINPKYENSEFSDRIRYQFVRNAGIFNKSWACNIGARLSCTGILIIADADMVLDFDALVQSIQVCHEHAEAVSPYEHIIDLSSGETRKYIDTGKLPEKLEKVTINRETKGEYICFCGGIYLMRKPVYFRIGGMDENFKGWGGEDDAMSIKLDRLGVSKLVKKNQVAWHLWHPRPGAKYHRSENYANNLALLDRYRKMSTEELQEYCSRSSASSGIFDRGITPGSQITETDAPN